MGIATMGSKTAGKSDRPNVPSDGDLLRHIDRPMRSFDVAYFFGADRREISKRLDGLVIASQLARPYHGFFAPVGCTAPRPLQGRSAQILALLYEPLTLAELDRMVQAGYTQRRVVGGLVRGGLVVALDDGRFVAASATTAATVGPPGEPAADRMPTSNLACSEVIAAEAEPEPPPTAT